MLGPWGPLGSASSLRESVPLNPVSVLNGAGPLNAEQRLAGSSEEGGMHSRTAPSWDWGGRAPRSQTGSVRPRPRLQGPSNELMKILTIVTKGKKLQ